MTNISNFLEMLAKETHQPESEVMIQALQAGLQHLWREHVLGNYLHGNISREEAIDSVGIDWVDLAERQQKAMKEDLEWGLRK